MGNLHIELRERFADYSEDCRPFKPQRADRHYEDGITALEDYAIAETPWTERFQKMVQHFYAYSNFCKKPEVATDTHLPYNYRP